MALAMLTASVNAATDNAVDIDQVRALCISAPRPQYPYEARARGITGAGVFIIGVDLRSGNTTGYKIVRSTGSPILDNATLAALRFWRFKPGSVSRVRIPIVFTMNKPAGAVPLVKQ